MSSSSERLTAVVIDADRGASAAQVTRRARDEVIRLRLDRLPGHADFALRHRFDDAEVEAAGESTGEFRGAEDRA